MKTIQKFENSFRRISVLQASSTKEFLDSMKAYYCVIDYHKKEKRVFDKAYFMSYEDAVNAFIYQVEYWLEIRKDCCFISNCINAIQ